MFKGDTFVFKRSIAVAAATAALTGAFVAPTATAASVKMTDEKTCAITFTDVELAALKALGESPENNTSFDAKTKTLTVSKESAAGSRQSLTAIISEAELVVVSPDSTEAQRDAAQKLLKAAPVLKGIQSAADACAAGHDYSDSDASSKDLGSSTDKGSSDDKAGSSDNGSQGSSSDKDAKDQADKTDKGDNPLSSKDGKLNGAGIGVVVAGSVVAVLGLVAAALPFIKSFLPSQVAALLPA